MQKERGKMMRGEKEEKEEEGGTNETTRAGDEEEREKKGEAVDEKGTAEKGKTEEE